MINTLKKNSLSGFASMPNFRLVNDSENVDSEGKQLPLLYRSSRPDLLTEQDLVKFERLGIRSIIDFRSPKEYRKASGNKLLDLYYPVYKVNLSLFGKVYPGNPTLKVITPSPTPPVTVTPYGKHFLIDFFRLNYILAVFNRAPLWFRLYSLLYLIYDVIMNTGYKYFVGAFAKKVLNKSGLTGQYLDMLAYSQPAIVSALKILSDPGNLPAMLNCAHGKDRTGIVSALVLGCMGKSKKYIAENYAVSAVELNPMKDRLHKEIVARFNMCTSFTTANYETMMRILDHIDHKYGSVCDYLHKIGFSKQDQDKLRQTLTGKS